jgi:selenocysteine lyase/cysteine desulfurase
MVQGQLPGQQYPYQGIRVTPNVYTTLEEIDTFAGAIEEVLKSGLPAAARTGA